MVFDASRIALLIYQSLTEDNTSEQQAELENWLDEAPQHRAFFDQMTQEEVFAYDLKAQSPARISVLRNELHSMIQRKTGMQTPLYPVAESNPIIQRIHFLKTEWFRYAAMLLLIAGTAIYIYAIHGRQKETAQQAAAFQQPDIAPGSNKAMLTLADGSTIVLDSAQNGMLAQQGNAQVIKLANGQLVYKLEGAASPDMLMNTMSTPRGGKFHLTLPDGTKAWLNAASSITYPAAFDSRERKVQVSGEVYFEVAKNKTKPFLVDVEGRVLIEVLGTHFNVNSYGDDGSMRTTLLEGSIKVNERTIKPGQQAQVALSAVGQPATSPISIINHVDIDKVMAWKNGLFNFEGASLQIVMKELERWYDIDVVYENGIPPIEFGGKLTKDLSLSDLLIGLERSDVHFRIEERKLIVLP